MWYPPSQQPARWHPYPSVPQSYSRTSYYSPTDDSSFVSHRTPSTNYVPARTDENDSLGHYQHRTRADDVYVTGTDYYVTSPRDEMSTSPTFSYSNCNPHWNPVIAAPIKPTTPPRNPTPLPHVRPSSSSSSSSACWDWLLYPPELYPQLYIASSSFIQHSIVNEDFDLVASLPSWLLVLLYPSMKSRSLTDDENESDQEISSLQKTSDEPLIDKNMTHVSSTGCLSTETISTSHAQQHPPQLSSNRSSTPDTDDGYQSASDASRSDYSQQSSCTHYDRHPPSKDDLPMNGSSTLMPKRISYAAAAVKPMETSKTCPSPFSTNVKPKNTSSNTPTSHDPLSSNGQKLKFIAPRFERMHHAKQYPSTTMNHSKDSSSSASSTSLLNRTSVRSHNNHNHHPRNHLMNSTRRR